MTIKKKQVEILQDTITITGADLKALSDGSNMDGYHTHSIFSHLYTKSGMNQCPHKCKNSKNRPQP